MMRTISVGRDRLLWPEAMMDRDLPMCTRECHHDAWSELVRLYTPMITGLIFSRIPRIRDMDDLVQETFFRAFQNIHTLRDPSRVGAWLYGITINVVREYRRKRPDAVRLTEVVVGQTEGETEIGISPEDLHECLQKLPLPLRETVILRHIEGLSYKVIAQIRNATISSVGERLWKARQLLRDCLEKKGNPDTLGNEVLS